MTLRQSDDLAAVFERDRLRLRRMAQGLLGDWQQAEDAVQDAWLKAQRLPPGAIVNAAGLLTTITTRLCLDRLRRQRRHGVAELDDPVTQAEVLRLTAGRDPEASLLAADAVGLALTVVLERLRPLERIAFVLHEILGMPFDEIAAAIDRSPVAARQLASRGRRRIRAELPAQGEGLARHRELAETFLGCARNGDLDGLVRLLHPDAQLTGDAAASALGLDEPRVGAQPVAAFFNGRASAARSVLLDGGVWIVVGPAATPRLVVLVTFEGDRLVRLHGVAEPLVLAGFGAPDRPPGAGPSTPLITSADQTPTHF